jgi:hypothetical protein
MLTPVDVSPFPALRPLRVVLAMIGLTAVIVSMAWLWIAESASLPSLAIFAGFGLFVLALEWRPHRPLKIK